MIIHPKQTMDAAERGHLNIAKLLLSYNAHVILKDIYGENAIHYARRIKG